jgi:hypothetical protein
VKSLTTAAIALITTAVAGLPAARADTATDSLVSTWTLAALERENGGDAPTRIRGSHGLLILDGAGHAFEFFDATRREESDTALSDAQRTFAEFGGFWGHYAADADAGRIEFTAEDGVSPNVSALTFTRDYALDGDRLVLTSTDEPQAQRNTRWTWERVPTVENLSPTYRQVIGFWQHVEERQVDEATGEIVRTNRRAPSVIVYTPGGFVGVHFPPRGRKRFAGAAPTAEEAQAALRGYIGYFGALSVYPGEVSHNILTGISPTPGSILRRYADIDGDTLVVRLEPLFRPASDRPRTTVTEVVLHRLSGAEDMLPRTH